MTETEHEPDDGLYLSDAAIIRKLGFGLKAGYRIIHKLEQPNRARRPYPQKDPLFGGRRFWPAVLQWHLDYHRVRTEAEAPTVTITPNWQETLDAFETPKARRPGDARPVMARA